MREMLWKLGWGSWLMGWFMPLFEIAMLYGAVWRGWNRCIIVGLLALRRALSSSAITALGMACA